MRERAFGIFFGGDDGMMKYSQKCLIFVLTTVSIVTFVNVFIMYWLPVNTPLSSFSAVRIMFISLIKKKNVLKESASGIDVQLKKRYDLIPNLMTMAAKYMEHEKSMM